MALSSEMIYALSHLNRNFCSEDYDKALSWIEERTEAKRIRFTKSGLNGWRIPPKWDLLEAYIKKDGKLILDGTKHPLSVISLSSSFQGLVDLSTLKEHLFYETYFKISDEAIPFHFRQNYQNWKRDWGFCVSKNFYNSLTDGYYEISIKTKEKPGYLDVLEMTHKGLTDQCFYLVSHLDHPGMSNDDLSGCAVGIQLFEELKKNRTKYTYKLLIVQEIIGSEYYLHSLPNTEKEKIKGGLFLEMLGSNTPFSLQRSYFENSLLFYPLKHALKEVQKKLKIGKYGSIIGNDEIVFEAHQIPMISLSRFPYPEYHTSFDNPSIIYEASLNESVQVLLSMIKKMETDIIVEKCFTGLCCLSSPDINLYVDLGMTGELATNELRKMRLLMDYLAFIKEPTSVNNLALRFKLSFKKVYDYLLLWEEKGLIELS